MPSEPFRETRGVAPADRSGPGSATRGRRLGKNARRDVRWAMQQQPRDHVRQVELHGVRISYNLNQGAKNAGLDGGVSSRHVEPPSQQTPRDPGTADPPLNSRRRRSKARQIKYFASWAAATPPDAPAAPMQLEQSPSSTSVDAASASRPAARSFEEMVAETRSKALNAAREAAGKSGRGKGNDERRDGEQHGRGRGRGGSK